MKRKMISMLLVLMMVVGLVHGVALPSNATSTLSITQPYDGQWISYLDPDRLEWEAVSGAAGYRVSIRNLESGELLVENQWRTARYFTLKGKLDMAASQYRIWVGAMASKSDPATAAFAASTITVYSQPEAPQIDDEGYDDVTCNSVTLSMELSKDNGSAIQDSGFYITSTTGECIKYSFKTYGSYSATAKGYKEMSISGLRASSQYWFEAYAVNGCGETVSAQHSFTTEATGGAGSDEPKFDSAPTVALSIDGAQIGTGLYGVYHPGDTIYLLCTAENTDHIFVENSHPSLVFTNTEGLVVHVGTFVEHSSESAAVTSYRNGRVFRGIPITIQDTVPAGDYTISVTGTDGVYDPAIWGSVPGTAHYPAVKTSLTVRIADPVSNSDKVFTSVQEVQQMITYNESNNWTRGSIVYIEQKFSGENSPNYHINYWGSTGGKGLCTRAASAAALSYFGITAYPKLIAPKTMLLGRELYDESISVNTPYTEFAASFGCDVVQYAAPGLKEFNGLFDRYVNGSASPIVLHTKHAKGLHAFLIVGKDPSVPNTYWTVDSGTNAVGIGRVTLTEKNGVLAVQSYYYAIPNGLTLSYDSKYSTDYALCTPGIWQYSEKGNQGICSHSYSSHVTAPDCTTAGYTTYTCTACGSSYTADYTEASGHSYFSDVTAPDCTTAGYTTYTCTACGSSYTADYTEASGHSYFSDVTAPTCTTGGYTTYTCTACDDSYNGNNTPAKGHSYAGGKCIDCGKTDPNDSAGVIKPTLTLKAPTLEFKDMITVNAFYTAENDQDVVEMGMITYSYQPATPNVATAEHIIPGATYEASSGRYYSSSHGIHGKYLGDTVYLAIYAKLSDGTYAYSKVASYSAVQYATSQLKNSTDTKLKQLVVAMLNYGAEAQLYFGHNTGSLANASLTAAQKALPAAYNSGMVSAVPAASAAKQGILANNQGFASRKPAISFEGAFCINYFFTPNYVPDSGITLYYWTAADYNANSVLSPNNATGHFKLEGSGTGEYRVDLTGIAAKELSEAVYVAAVYTSGSTTWTSGVLGYSIGAYCSSQANKTGTISDLAAVTAVYGYHAKQYFG